MQIGFNNNIYMASEDDGTVDITVSILNGILSQELEIAIGILTLDDTATCKTVYPCTHITQNDSGIIIATDYEPVNRTLIFDSKRDSHTISVTIVDDEIDEEDELLLIVLQVESDLSNIQLLPAQAMLIIVDNDGKTSNIACSKSYELYALYFILQKLLLG